MANRILGDKKSTVEKLKKWKNLTYLLLALAVVIMICVAAASHNNKVPGRTQAAQKWVRKSISQKPGVLFGCPTLKKGIMFTIDAGPSINTPLILDVLNKANLSAVFFLLPENIETLPEYAKQIVSDGHQIGLYLHTEDTKDVKQVISRGDDVLYNVTGQRSRLIRPSSGQLDTWVKEATSQGYTIVLWNAATHRVDGLNLRDDAKLAEHALAFIPHYGAILSLSEQAKITAKLLDQIVEELRVEHRSSNRFLPGPYLRPVDCFGPFD